jgi:hypothetical protein
VVLAGGIAAIVASVNHEVTKSVTVKYSVTGTARNVAIAYSTWRNENLSTSQETARTLPWSKNVTTKGFVKGGSLAVTLGAEGGTATCSVVVDNGKPHTATASGPFASADCSGF